MGRYIIDLDGSRYLVETKISDGVHRFYRAHAKLLMPGESIDEPTDALSDDERALLELHLRTLKHAPSKA
jgi:hypothetical protein